MIGSQVGNVTADRTPPGATSPSGPAGVVLRCDWPNLRWGHGNLLRPLHVVQIGSDDTVFADDAPSDTLRRQLWYARELARQRPGSRMSVLMFTGSSAIRRFQLENAVFVPVRATMPHELPKLYTALASLHRERSIDVIATQTIYQDAWIAMLFGWRNGIPIVGQIHNDIFSPFAQRGAKSCGPFRKARHAVGMRLIKKLYAVRVVGRRIRDRMLAEGIHSRVYLAPAPVTMASGVAAEPEDGRQGGRVLFVGRLVAEKNMNAWLRVAALVAGRHPLATFEVLGDGPLRSHLQAEAERLGIASRVTFRGFVPYDALPALYRSSAVLLISSHSEGFGRVVVEAGLQGVPAVGPQIGGLEDIVEDGKTGFLHPSGDDEAMATSVCKLLGDGDLRRQMGRAARELMFARFDPKQLAKGWVSLLVSAAIRAA
jgi:glycosyltransferase involved in cell wall biosynthesis